MRAHLLCLLLAVASLGVVPTPALAAPVVLHGPDDDAVSAATHAKEVLGSGDFRVAGSIGAVLGGDPAALLALGARLSACGGGGDADFVTALAEAAAWVDQMEYASAMGTIDAVVEALPCNGGKATRAQLFDAWFLRGIAAFNDGDEAAAKRAFGAATRLDPSRKWDDAFPPTPKPIYLEALQETLASPAVLLKVQADGVMLDGKALARGSSSPVRAGEHLVTYGGAIFGLLVDENTAGVALVTAGAVEAGVLSGSEQGAAWLRGASEANGWDDVLIVAGDQARRFRDGKWVLDADVANAAQGPAPMVVAGAATAGAGLGILLGGVGANVAAWQRAALSDDGKATPLSRAEYESARTQTQVSTGLIAAGAATMAVGVGLTVVGLVTGGPSAMAVTPSFGASPDGLAFGVSGRF